MTTKAESAEHHGAEPRAHQAQALEARGHGATEPRAASRGHETSAHQGGKEDHQEPKVWEFLERADRAERDVEIATAAHERAVTIQAAEQERKEPKKLLDQAVAKSHVARRDLNQASEAVKHLTSQLHTVAQKIEAHKDDEAALEHKLNDIAKLLADLNAKHADVATARTAFKEAEQHQREAEEDFHKQEPLVQAKFELATLKASADFAKAEAIARKKFADVRRNFDDRGVAL